MPLGDDPAKTVELELHDAGDGRCLLPGEKLGPRESAASEVEAPEGIVLVGQFDLIDFRVEDFGKQVPMRRMLLDDAIGAQRGLQLDPAAAQRFRKWRP